ncbi:MAG: glycoside hydrolase family 5 protein [Acidothermaceae bacterium]
MTDLSVRAGRFEGFVHVSDGELVDASGKTLRLRGVGLGNWFLPEGYMWKFEPGGPLAPREIERYFTDLVGPARNAEFWREFRARFITEADIARIAAEGFDHVRLAINSRIVLTDSGEIVPAGFGLIDQLIDWCRAHQLWVVLDLHGAPGGQTGTNIDDSPHGLPDLFVEGGDYVQQTLDLWRVIAGRYSDEPVVAAYDLLNEPLPNEYQYAYADALADLYKQLTKVIREVDQNHVIVYEGTHWSNNWSIFTEVWDPNTMLQCHKYWNPPDRPSVQGYLDKAAELGLPIYMGETGENNLDWMQTAFQLYEESGMSWNLWPWKKIDTVTSPCSIDPPDGWADVVAYARGQSDDKPDPERAWAILTELLDRIDISRCTYRQDVVNAVMRRAPLRIPAWGFGFGGAGVSYHTSNAAPLPGFRSDDEVTLECANGDDPDAPSFHHNNGALRGDDEHIVVRLLPGDWITYDVEISVASGVCVSVTLGSGESSREPTLDSANEPATDTVDDCGVELSFDGTVLPGLSDGCDTVAARTLGTVTAGRHRVTVAATSRPVVLRWVDVTPCP